MRIGLFGSEFWLRSRLRSKKNRVYLVENNRGYFVMKIYRAPHHLNSTTEHRALLAIRRCGVAAPQPLAFIERKALLMEYIPGSNLCDLLSCRCLPEYADQLAGWYGAFHRCFGRPAGGSLLRGDSNVRNFILHRSGALHGVDFEEAAWGDPARDLGQICASILDTEPMFTPAKAALCRRLIARYEGFTGRKYLEQQITGQVVRALRETAQRRPHQRDFLLEQAELLEQHGLGGSRRDGGFGHDPS